jgi:hypothetical protein
MFAHPKQVILKERQVKKIVQVNKSLFVIVLFIRKLHCKFKDVIDLPLALPLCPSVAIFPILALPLCLSVSICCRARCLTGGAV